MHCVFPLNTRENSHRPHSSDVKDRTSDPRWGPSGGPLGGANMALPPGLHPRDESPYAIPVTLAGIGGHPCGVRLPVEVGGPPLTKGGLGGVSAR
jgi:hypothetical protein